MPWCALRCQQFFHLRFCIICTMSTQPQRQMASQCGYESRLDIVDGEKGSGASRWRTDHTENCCGHEGSSSQRQDGAGRGHQLPEDSRARHLVSESPRKTALSPRRDKTAPSAPRSSVCLSPTASRFPRSRRRTNGPHTALLSCSRKPDPSPEESEYPQRGACLRTPEAPRGCTEEHALSWHGETHSHRRW